jgi:hypothetical protein
MPIPMVLTRLIATLLPTGDGTATMPARRVVPEQALAPKERFAVQEQYSDGWADLGEIDIAAQPNVRSGRRKPFAGGLDKRSETMSRWITGVAASCLAVTSAAQAQGLVVWAVNDGEKVKRDDLANPNKAGNSAWDGKKITLFGACNEVIAFQILVEGGEKGLEAVSAALPQLAQKGGAGKIVYAPPAADPTQYVGRPIQLFSQHYLQVAEPTKANWSSVPTSPSAPKDYTGWIPVVLVPENAKAGMGGFPVKVRADQNQGFWVDIYLARDLPAGTYHGEVTVTADGAKRVLPVELEVFDFALPDQNSLPAMFYFDPIWVKMYHGEDLQAAYHRLAHRHRIELVTDTAPDDLKQAPGRYNGKDFTAANGYDGPGAGVGNRIVPRTFYGPGDTFDTQEGAWKDADAWIKRLSQERPGAITFVYLPDEPSRRAFPGIVKIGKNLHSNPGPGKALLTLVTHAYTDGLKDAIDIWCLPPNRYNPAKTAELKKAGKQCWFYNGGRPAVGAVIVDAPATDSRMMAWAAFKHDADGYFYWYANHWRHNRQMQKSAADRRQNIWLNPITFDNRGQPNKPIGSQGFIHGDGVVLFPGQEKVHADQDRGVPGPCASIQLANFRRGLQDHLYLTLARKAGATAAIEQALKAIVPVVLGETKKGDKVAFAEDGNAYEKARYQLAKALAAKR